MSDEGSAMEQDTPRSLAAEVEFDDRIDVEVLRLELQRLVRRYGAEVKTVRLERRLD